MNWHRNLYHLGSAINCYECNSFNDTRCANDVPPSDLSIFCSTTKDGRVSTTCRKIVQQIEFSVNGCKNIQIDLYFIYFIKNVFPISIEWFIPTVQPDLRIIRTCAHDDSETKVKCYKRAGFGGRQVVCGCESDNCNGSMSLKSMTLLPIAFVAAVAYLFHLWWC